MVGPSHLRGRIGRSVAFAALSLLAACIDEPPAAPEVPDRPPAPTTLAIPNNATGCTRAMPAIFIDKAHARTFLPPGFAPADERDFFHTPGPATGRAVVLLTAVVCKASETRPQGYEEASVGIFVEAPRVANATSVPDHMYELGRAASEGPLRANLSRLGWPLIGTKVTSTFTASPVPSGAASVADPNGTVFSVSVPAAPYQDPFNIHIRWWHDTPDGLGFFDYRFRVDGRLGAGQCTLRPGTIAARLAQSTICPPGTLFMVGPPFDVESRFEHRPGLRAAAS